MGPDRLDPALQRGRPGRRREGRADRRGARPGRGPGQPRPSGREGPLRLAGQRLPGPAHPPARAGGRRAGGDGLGHGHGPDRRAHAGTARGAGGQRPGLLHQRPAVRRGVLHARADRPRRPGHQPRGRQHPPVHGHRRRGPQGVLRLRRPAGQLHGHRPRGRHRPLRAQHGRDPVRAVDAHPGPPRRPQPAPADLRGPAPHPGGPPRRRAPGPEAWHQRGADERPAARAHRPRPHGPGLPRRPHGRLRGAGAAGPGVHARARGPDLRRAAGADPRGRPHHRRLGAAALHRAAGLLPVPPGHRGGRAGQQRAPDPRHARPPGLRDPADERPAHGGEHARVRRGRGPAGLPQLVQ